MMDVLKYDEMPYISPDSGRSYTFRFWANGDITCDCGDFVHRRRKGRSICKHIRYWKLENGLIRQRRTFKEVTLVEEEP